MIQAGNGELYCCVDGGGSRSRGRFVDIVGVNDGQFPRIAGRLHSHAQRVGNRQGGIRWSRDLRYRRPNVGARSQAKGALRSLIVLVLELVVVLDLCPSSRLAFASAKRIS